MADLTGQSGPVSSREDFPAADAFAVVPDDATTQRARSLYVGGTGDVSVEMLNGDGTAVTFSAVPAGTILPIAVRRVRATGTGASNIVGLI